MKVIGFEVPHLGAAVEGSILGRLLLRNPALEQLNDFLIFFVLMLDVEQGDLTVLEYALLWSDSPLTGQTGQYWGTRTGNDGERGEGMVIVEDVLAK